MVTVVRGRDPARGSEIRRLPHRAGQGGRPMNTGRNWQDVKADAHRRYPELTDPERKARARAALDAYVAGHHLKELRKAVGKTQQELARALGVSQSRISQIENGKIEAMELETLRAYASALGGTVDITISVGPHSVRVA